MYHKDGVAVQNDSKMKPTTKLQKALSAGQTVLIEFVKKDSSVRRARVTTNLSNIPAEKHPKGGKSSKKTICFFDLKKGDWISCCAERLMMVKPERTETPAQIRRKQQRKERWALVQRIIADYHFTIGQALSIASGKTVDRCNLQNMSL